VFLLTFGYAFLLALFVADLPYPAFLFPTLMLAFITHATLGVRSTVQRYLPAGRQVGWRSWVDGIFLAVWLGVSAAFIWAVYLR